MTPTGSRSTRGQVALPGGTFAMGDHFGEGDPADGERPVHPVTLSPFRLDATTVTNAAFATFAKDTGYVTDAERHGSSAVFHLAFSGDRGDVLTSVDGAGWWLGVRGACWRAPEGPGSSVGDRANHPVVHVSWDDAPGLRRWAGQAPAHRGRVGVRRPRRARAAPVPVGRRAARRGGRWPLNIWQGRFPTHNTAEDGFATTAPVEAFRPNGYGL